MNKKARHGLTRQGGQERSLCSLHHPAPMGTLPGKNPGLMKLPDGHACPLEPVARIKAGKNRGEEIGCVTSHGSWVGGRASVAAIRPLGHYLTFLRLEAAASCMRLLGRILALTGSEGDQRVLPPASPRDQLQYPVQVRRNGWVMFSSAEGLELRDQLPNVLLMKHCNCFVVDETKVREFCLVEIHEKALNERVIIPNSLQHPDGRGPCRIDFPVHYFPEHVNRHNAH
jgi:hypothetical protein